MMDKEEIRQLEVETYKALYKNAMEWKGEIVKVAPMYARTEVAQARLIDTMKSRGFHLILLEWADTTGIDRYNDGAYAQFTFGAGATTGVMGLDAADISPNRGIALCRAAIGGIRKRAEMEARWAKGDNN